MSSSDYSISDERFYLGLRLIFWRTKWIEH